MSRWITMLFAMTLVVGPVAAEPGSFELPPPPSARTPPPVDLALLAMLRPAPVVPVVEDSAVAAQNTALRAILADMGREGGGRALLESMLFSQLREALPGGEDYLLERAIIPDHLELPATGWKVRFEFRLPPRGVGRALYTARLTEADGGEARRFSGSVMVDREIEGVTVTRLVRRGEKLNDDDLEALPVRMSQLPRGAYDQVGQVSGSEARRELRPGQWLTEQMVSVPDLVRRGQAVTLRLESGSLTITAAGVVQEAGGRGELVRVRNAQSGKEIFARVLSNEEVQVIR